MIWTIIIGHSCWLAGKLMRGNGFGIGSLIVAAVGAIIFIWFIRLVKR